MFRSDAALPPGRILLGHLGNQFANIPRQKRPSRSRFPAPEQLKPPAMPPNQGLRLNDGQRLFPVQPTRPEHQCDPRRIGQSTGFHFTLLVESQLLTQKQILGNERTPGTYGCFQKTEEVNTQVCEGCEESHESGRSESRHGRRDCISNPRSVVHKKSTQTPPNLWRLAFIVRRAPKLDFSVTSIRQTEFLRSTGRASLQRTCVAARWPLPQSGRHIWRRVCQAGST